MVSMLKGTAFITGGASGMRSTVALEGMNINPR